MGVEEIKNMVHDLAAMLVDEPGEISIIEEERNSAIIVVISVAKDDVGKIIGKNGQTAKALRALVNAVSTRIGKKVLLEIRE
jgi:predicted RNA-binding protein YlqC (UPF0109 family)